MEKGSGRGGNRLGVEGKRDRDGQKVRRPGERGRMGVLEL